MGTRRIIAVTNLLFTSKLIKLNTVKDIRAERKRPLVKSRVKETINQMALLITEEIKSPAKIVTTATNKMKETRFLITRKKRRKF